MTVAMDRQTFRLSDRTVTLGTPRVVAEGVGHVWFPDLRAFPTGELFIAHAIAADANDNMLEGVGFLVSTDRGETWDLRYTIPQRLQIPFPQPDGSLGGLGGNAFPSPPGQARSFVAHFLELLNGGRKYTLEPRSVRIEGLPRDVQPSHDSGSWRTEVIAHFWSSGDTIDFGDELVGTAYLKYVGDAISTNIAIGSSDGGRTWRYLADVAGPDDAPGTQDGPCEASMTRLADGDLMCVMRTSSHKTPLVRSYSSDRGRTWTKADHLPAWGVYPSLRRLSNGRVAISTGRPGIQFWLSTDQRGQSWEMIDVVAHHNAIVPPAQQIGVPTGPGNQTGEQTTAYTMLVEVAPGRLLLAYDRTPFGWAPVPLDSEERSRIYVLPIEIGEA